MSNNCHIQTANCLLIAVPLDASCRIVEDAPVYVTAGVGSMTVEKERQDPTDYSAPNFGGVACGPEQKGETVEKWGNGSGEFCLVDWAFQAATSGNPIVLDATGNVIGYQELKKSQLGACSPQAKPRVALVVIRKSATSEGGCSAPTVDTGATTCVAHFFPNTTDWQWDIPPFEDGRAMVPFAMTAYSNPVGSPAGPLNLWPAGGVPNKIDPNSFHSQAFVACGGLPSPNCDVPLEHPAPETRA